MLHEIENGWTHKWDRVDKDDCDLRYSWIEMCKQIPFSMGTDCKSLYDVCTKNGSMPEEKRVALDLLDLRESVEELGDQIRWIPTDHMLVDCMTKNMPPDAMLGYLKTMDYAFKYDDVIKNTKREIAKQRKAFRQKLSAKDVAEKRDINLVEHYSECYALFSQQAPSLSGESWNLLTWTGDFGKLRKEIGYRAAYIRIVDDLFSR